MSDIFNATKVADKLKKQTATIRKKSYSLNKSRLDKCKDELLALKKEGLSNAELQRWLRSNKRIKVALSTVQRWVVKYG